jgi:8-oxo-dGTP pyrophosphatase MutT (NUDIX family)
MSLSTDALALLDGWTAPDREQAAVQARFLELVRSTPDAVRRDHPEAHLTASVMVVHDDLERVLLCLHGRMHRWVQLGGHLEPEDDTVAAAALREATEESGIHRLRLHPVPIHLDVHPVECRCGPALHYDVRFAALAPPDAVESVSEESLRLGWFGADELPQPLAHATEPLVLPALTAARALRAGDPRRAGAARPQWT